MNVRLFASLWLGVMLSSSLASAQTVTPSADHHTHLISPAVAEVINGEPLPRVAVPRAIAVLLEQRAERWNDGPKLAGLYATDAVGFIDDGSRSGLFRGGPVLAKFLADRFARPYKLTPVSISVGGAVANVSGYYSRGEGADLQRAGFFNLALVKQPGGWRIQSEFPTFPTAPRFAPTTSADLVRLLDQASIEKAAVLSGASAFGGRYLDFYEAQRSASELHSKVRAENDWVRAEAARYPTRLLSFCAVNPLAAFAESELRRCKATGHHGLKLHFLESGVDLAKSEHVATVRRLFALADELRLPIVVHVGNNDSAGNNEGDAISRAAVRTFFDSLVASAPNVTIQVAHLWGGGAFSEAALTAYADRMAKRAPDTRNVYFDMSEAPLIANQSGGGKTRMLASVALAMRRIGFDRILFGSDVSGPGHLEPAAAWTEFMRDVPLTAGEFQIVAGNVAPYFRQ